MRLVRREFILVITRNPKPAVRADKTVSDVEKLYADLHQELLRKDTCLLLQLMKLIHFYIAQRVSYSGSSESNR